MKNASDELRVAISPFAAYRAVREERRGMRMRALRGPLLLALFYGAFASLTSGGRLLLDHVVLDGASWLALSALCGLAAMIASLVVRAGAKPAEVLDLYFLGFFPLRLLFTLLAAICVLSPDPWGVVRPLLDSYALLAIGVATFAYGVVLTFACFSAGLALGRNRGALATLVFYLVLATLALTYFALTEQLTFLTRSP